ncbi:5,10-methylenetetrahydrofolate reductase [Boudabousia tangfeifanii]|uniref:Methylenetetrahydrofolate reductase n=1 Tax=Boudabousia tangfeifanii TaxID=1912795 RepID=A0A1D9MMJ4_9ACTO|nr:5,10-methylenetetrahydrofolate reductase [Boudabousia tangfeifanii]
MVSFELFPSRQPSPDSSTWTQIHRLLAIAPDYASVTFGASGSAAEGSLEVIKEVQAAGLPTLSHLTCVQRTRSELADLIKRMMDQGVRDFLALRGDPPRGETEWKAPTGGLNYASELVHLLRETSQSHLGDAKAIDICVAAYPAGSPAAREDTLDALGQKAAAGADWAITQVFFESADYQQLLDSCAYRGINLPIVPGVIPFTDLKRLNRLQGLTGVEVPEKLRTLLTEPDPQLRTRHGIRATLEFIADLLDAGAPGIHLYTFNRTRPALDILEYLRVRQWRPQTDLENLANDELLAQCLRRLPPVL